MAQNTALRLVDPKAAFPQVTPENFASFRERLKAQAAVLFVVTSLRAPLQPRSVDAEVTEELDIVFKIVFPRPAAGRLHFHASFLQKVGEGFGGTIFVSDPAGKDLGWDQITWENPNFEINVPSDSPPKKKP